MEILNQNKRNSALWRLTWLGVTILTMIIILLSTGHYGYEAKMESRLKQQEEDYKKGAFSNDKTIREIKRQVDSLRNANSVLEQRVRDSGGSAQSWAQDKKSFESQLTQKDGEIRIIKEKNDFLKQQLDACRLNKQK